MSGGQTQPKESWRKKQCFKHNSAWVQIILQSYGKQNHIVLQKPKHRSMKDNRKPRNKPMIIWSTNLWKRRQ